MHFSRRQCSAPHFLSPQVLLSTQDVVKVIMHTVVKQFIKGCDFTGFANFTLRSGDIEYISGDNPLMTMSQ